MARSKRRRPVHPEGPEELTTEMADYLIEIPKIPIDSHDIIQWAPGMDLEINLQGREPQDRDRRFRLIIERSEIKTGHAKFQLMTRRSTILVRVEINGPPHENPGGVVVPCPHIHRYQEGSGVKYAKPLGDDFSDPSDLRVSRGDFLAYCNVVQLPPFEGLFR